MDFLLFCFDRSGRKYYHARFMSARASIDSLEFARAGAALSGNVPVSELPRLADSLFDTDGNLQFDLKGGRDSRERLRLHLTVAGNIDLQCQRCLGRLAYPVAVQANLLVLTDKETGDAGEVRRPRRRAGGAPHRRVVARGGRSAARDSAGPASRRGRMPSGGRSGRRSGRFTVCGAREACAGT